MKQTGSVSEYQAKFEELSTKVTGLSEAWLISFFIVGLQDHLKCELLLAQPNTYHQTISLAKLHEQKLATMQNSFKGNAVRGVVNMEQSKSVGNHSTYFLSNNKQSNATSGSFRSGPTAGQGNLASGAQQSMGGT